MSTPNKIPKKLAPYAAIAAMAMPFKGDAAPIYTEFIPSQTATLAGPTVGLAENDNNYLLTRETLWTTLEKDLTGEKTGLEPFVTEHAPFPYPHIAFAAIDAASNNNNYMFLLGTDNGIRQINTSTGAQSLPFDAVDAGNNAFGIGYDASINQIGVASYSNGNMTFTLLDGSTGSELSTSGPFSFDTSLYGTPTGGDLVDKNGNLRFIIGTRDGPGETMFSPNQNYILDMSAANGSIDQYSTTFGDSAKLQDLIYNNGQLTLVKSDGTGGLIQQGNFAAIPEPSTIALVGLTGLAAILFGKKRR